MTKLLSLRCGFLFRAVFATAVFAGICAHCVNAQPYTVGNIVTNELTLLNRLRWTNDNGQVFTPSNTVLRLSDFDGKIVFFVFFDVW